MALNILILYGPNQKNGCGNKAAEFVKRCLYDRGHEPVLINACQYKPAAGETADDTSLPCETPVYTFSTLSDIIRKADAFVIVSAEDNCSTPKPLNDLMEYFVGEYFFRPSGIVTYSSDMFGGVRASMQLRSFLSEMGTVSIPTTIRIPRIQDFLNTTNAPENDDYEMFMNQFLDDLEWYSLALKEGRRNTTVPY